MEKRKIDRVIEAFRHYIQLKEEGGMVANVPGSQGGGGSQTDPKGTKGLVGFDPVIEFDGRSRIARRLPPPYRRSLNKKRKP